MPAETANSWRWALMQRRAGHDRIAPPQAVAGRCLRAWQPVSSSHRRATHSSSLSTLLAKSGCSTRLASKSRVWTPRSHWRCRSNASTSAAYVHLSTVATSCRIGGCQPVDNCRDTRGAQAIRLAWHPERRQTAHTMSAHSPKAASARSVPLAKRAAVTEDCSPLPVRSFLLTALPGLGRTGPRLPCAF